MCVPSIFHADGCASACFSFTFGPLLRMGLLPSLGHWHGWLAAYGIATSNLVSQGCLGGAVLI